MTYRVIVTASRNWKIATSIYTTLHERAVQFGWEGFTVVHGDSGNGDKIAQNWALMHAHLGVINEPHPAQWRIAPRAPWNRHAGVQRNQFMVDLGADECLAFAARCVKPGCTAGPDPHYSHGTVNCAALASIAGIPVTWKKVPLR